MSRAATAHFQPTVLEGGRSWNAKNMPLNMGILRSLLENMSKMSTYFMSRAATAHFNPLCWRGSFVACSQKHA